MTTSDIDGSQSSPRQKGDTSPLAQLIINEAATGPNLNDEKKKFEHSIEMNSRDFLTIVAPIGQLQQSTSPTATVTEVQGIQTIDTPSVSPGIYS